MNYISVSSTAVHRQRVEFPGPTYIDYYAENNAATSLKAGRLAAQLQEVLMAERSGLLLDYPQRPLQREQEERAFKCEDEIPVSKAAAAYSPHGFFHNYKVNMPPLAVLGFLEQHGYKVVRTNTIGSIRDTRRLEIGDTFMWTLHKQAETTDQSTPQMALRIIFLLIVFLLCIFVYY